jgi:GT2 family glycosyltransferase
MTEPRTTVVIATRDRRDDLARTLAHLRRNAPGYPVVVMDNGSRDGTAAFVRAEFPSVRVLELRRNLGSSARNVGVRYAGTPFVAFSDDDSWWAPGALAEAEAVFDRSPRLGLIAGKTLVGPDNRPDPLNDVLAESPFRFGTGLPGPVVLGFLCCASVVRREAYLRAGGIDPVLFFTGEEKLLAWDLAAAGWACCYVDAVVAHHHPSTRRAGIGRRRALELRNDLLTTWLRRPARTGVAAFGALAARGARDPIARSALLGALLRLPAAVRARRPLPRTVQELVDVQEMTARRPS